MNKKASTSPSIRDLDLSFIEDDLEAMGMQRLPAEAGKLLNMLWPEVTHDLDGTWHMPADQAALLNRFFELFGVPLRTENAPLSSLERGYGMLMFGVGHFVQQRLRQPAFYDWRTKAWPSDWRAYIEAIARFDTKEARRLALRLQPLDEACAYPDPMLTLVAQRERESRP